ncbi:MAG: hypothetical protein QXX35_03435 [Desulfurococcaceae archaeon]|uniref:Uncharacterized protein n=1 Tax=Staphylothermus marinus TaxID=2280 RepID=A0A7C4HD21_STAMA
MTRYPDFLRHIVNPILSKYIVSRKNLTQVIDEIRRLLIDAEDKYRFSVFGGNPEKLVDYFKSDDFRIMYRLFNSINSLDILREILETTREKHVDLPELVKVIDELINKIEKEVSKGK